MSDIGYHLVVDPGDRDPERILAALRDEMPAVMSEAFEGGHENEFWIEDGTIHWSTDYPTQIGMVSLVDRVPDLNVPGRWALIWFEQETRGSRGCLYTRIDDDWALVEDRHGGCEGRAVTTYMRAEWGVDCEVIQS